MHLRCFSLVGLRLGEDGWFCGIVCELQGTNFFVPYVGAKSMGDLVVGVLFLEFWVSDISFYDALLSSFLLSHILVYRYFR